MTDNWETITPSIVSFYPPFIPKFSLFHYFHNARFLALTSASREVSEDMEGFLKQVTQKGFIRKTSTVEPFGDFENTAVEEKEKEKEKVEEVLSRQGSANDVIKGNRFCVAALDPPTSPCLSRPLSLIVTLMRSHLILFPSTRTFLLSFLPHSNLSTNSLSHPLLPHPFPPPCL